MLRRERPAEVRELDELELAVAPTIERVEVGQLLGRHVHTPLRQRAPELLRVQRAVAVGVRVDEGRVDGPFKMADVREDVVDRGLLGRLRGLLFDGRFFRERVELVVADGRQHLQ